MTMPLGQSMDINWKGSWFPSVHSHAPSSKFDKCDPPVWLYSLVVLACYDSKQSRYNDFVMKEGLFWGCKKVR